MTHPRRRAYRPRPTVRAHPRSLSAALALAALACSGPPQASSGPVDRLVFPASVAVRGQDVLVVSTNFDLLYSEQEGGTVLALSAVPPAVGAASGVNIGSLGGEIAIADAAACGLSQTLALVPSRSTNALYRLAVGPDGIPTCGQGCAIPLRSDLADPYGVAVACRAGGPNRVFLSYLRTPNLVGYVTMFTFDPDASLSQQLVQTANVGVDPARSFAYDQGSDRVYFTGASTGATALFRWFDLAGGCRIDVASTDPTACPLSAMDLFPLVRGADLRGIALSTPIPGQPRRAYVAARLFDADVAATIGGRPNYDIGGVLLVLELDEGPDGRIHPQLVNTIDAGLGVSEVAVLGKRPAAACSNPAGCRDLVAVTSGDAGLFQIYDDEVGAMRRVFGRDVNGAPELGRFPFGLAVVPLDPTQGPSKLTQCQIAGECARVYVSAFQDNFVSAVDVPLADPGSAALVVTSDGLPWRIGGAP